MKTKNTDIYIHIGFHKTGSTFLQQKIFSSVVDTNSILSPDVTYLAESNKYNSDYFISILKKEWGFNKNKKTIISQEVLSGRGDGNPKWDRYLIAQRLHKTFPDAKILIVIRNQLDYILSLYSFRVVKRGLERQSLSKYLEEKFEKRLFEKLSYDKLVKHYIDLFGKDNVMVLTYEELNQDHGKFIQSILTFMNIDTIPPYNPQKINVSSRFSEIILINRLLNYPISIMTDFLRRNRMLSQKQCILLAKLYVLVKQKGVNPALKKILTGSRKIDFETKWKDILLSKFRESNWQLTKLINIDLQKYNYPL